MLGLLASAAALTLFTVSLQIASAQSDPNDVLQRALQQRDNQDNVPPNVNAPTVQTYMPVVTQVLHLPPSRLEELYTQRAGAPLKQFGYEFLGTASTVSIAQTGEVSDNFILGAGDSLQISLRGQENSTYRVRVDRGGLVLIPKLKPILAAGRTFGDFRRELQAQVAQAYLSTEVFVALGEVHQFSIVVSGDVRSPGSRIVNSLASPLDAILLSGGISKTGSLRNVQLLRDGTRRTIDLYSIIAQGNASQLGSLRDGDRIYVPPLGATVAVSGYVRRPGIYELAGNARGISALSLMRLAGGILISGSYNLSKTSLDRDGSTRLLPIPQGATIDSGEVLFVDANKNAGLDRVRLAGAVSLDATHPLSLAKTTSDLIQGVGDLASDAYTPLAVIVRRDTSSNTTTLVPFSVTAAIQRRSPVALQSYDTVYIFNSVEIRALAAVATKDANAGYNPYQPNGPSAERPAPSSRDQPNGQAPDGQPNDAATAAANGSSPPSTPVGSTPPLNGDPNALNPSNVPDPLHPSQPQSTSAGGEALSQANNVARRENGTLPRVVVPLNETDAQIVGRVASTLHVPADELVRMADDNIVWVLDQVYAPGPYLAAHGTTLAEMIQAAGGATQRADLSSIDVTSTELDQMTGVSRTLRESYSVRDVAFAAVPMRSQDVIRLRPIFTDRDEGTVTVAGQVRFPGAFDITRGERLSSVLERAGGLTDVAYPYGAIFTRKEAAINERQGNERAAREIEGQIAALATSTNAAQATSGNVTYLSSVAQRLRDTPVLGRVMVTADPTVLATKPELDVILQPGDTLFIPKRPSSVTVTGEVLNPGSFQFRSGMTIDDYVRLAGAATQSAEYGRTFVVLPDGSAKPREASWLSFDSGGNLPPGSTIVVPRDLHPFDWTQFLKDLTQITSQLAVTAASLSVLGNNN